jgi:hypothetical protein
MTRTEFLSAVARRTGEPLSVIRARGFQPVPLPAPARPRREARLRRRPVRLPSRQ